MCAVQWLGWRPDVTPQYMQAQTSRDALGLREKEMNARREMFNKSLEQNAWDRMMRESKMEQDWARALMTDVTRRDIAKEAEVGRGIRARETQERLLDANEKLMFRTWWKDAPEEARQAVKDSNPKVVEDALGFIPSAERYEKPLKMTAKEFEAGKREIGKEAPGGTWATSKFLDVISPWAREGEKGRIQKRAGVEKRKKKLDERFLAQWPDVGVGEAIKAKEAKVSVVRTGTKNGRPVAKLSDGRTVYTDTGEAVK